MKKSEIWIVVPVYNEDKYLERFLSKLIRVTKNIIVVNDGSRDKTVKIAKKFTPYVLSAPNNFGKGAAMRCGAQFVFRHLQAKAVIFMDGDDQHLPSDLNYFYRELNKNYVDLIFGARRFGNEMPLARMIGNRVASFLVYLFYGKFIYDIPSGFKAMTKKGFTQVKWKSDDYSVEMEIAVRAIIGKVKISQVEISTFYHDLDRGMQFDSVMQMFFCLLRWKIFGLP